jgi:hypothetical protein
MCKDHFLYAVNPNKLPPIESYLGNLPESQLVGTIVPALCFHTKLQGNLAFLHGQDADRQGD